MFSGEFFASHITSIGWSRKYKIKVDLAKRKVFLRIYDEFNNLLEEKISWSFDMLKEKLYRKLKYLAIISCNLNIVNGTFYYKYFKAELFELKDFEFFLSLIENGKISVSFNIGIYRTPQKLGQTYNHGVRFGIKYEDIDLLFDKIREI